MNNRTDTVDSPKYSFIMFGNSRFGGYYHRGHAIARELATRGHQVLYIEEMPSLAAELRRRIRRLFFKHAIDEQSDYSERHDAMSVLRPPFIPTLFRSSYTPMIDRWIFKVWFGKKFRTYNFKDTIAIVMLPYWWYGFINKKKHPFKFIHYDVYDEMEVSSRNETALNRMKEGERRLRNDIDVVTFSAHSMKAGISRSFPNVAQVCIPNAVSGEFLSHAIRENPPETTRKHIGFIGTLDPRWVDTELLLYTIESFPLCDFSICGSADRTFARRLQKYPNAKLMGFMNHGHLAAYAATFDLGLIPFKQNKITRVVNPLKLYEYAAAGIPVVATKTEELEYYRDFVSLADTNDEFIHLIIQALHEDTLQKHQERKEWAQLNTWSHRMDGYLSFLKNSLDAH